MGSLSHKLCINKAKGTAVFSDESGASADLPPFLKYETIPFEVTIVEPKSPWGPNDLQKVDITNLSLTISLSDVYETATPKAQTSGGSWTKDTAANTFTGVLVLNTAAMNAYLGTGADKAMLLEVEVTDSVTGARKKILAVSVTIKQSVTQTSSTSPDPNNEYYTKAEMLGVFVPRILKPGETIEWRDPATQQLYREFGVRSDGTPQDDT